VKRDTLPPPFFVGDHLALDFLNSVAAPSGAPIEWLANGAGLLAWLQRAGAIDEAVVAHFRARSEGLDNAARQARELREWFRAFVKRHAGRGSATSALRELEPLNRLLARDTAYWQVIAEPRRPKQQADSKHKALEWSQHRRWTSAEQLLQPIAEALGDLVCHADFRRIRACEAPTCTLIFYDKTRGQARRWCSMTVCGNRAKAAAHRARLRKGRRGIPR